MTKQGRTKRRKRNAGRRSVSCPTRKRRAGRATESAACAALRLRARSPAGVPPRHLRQRPNATAQLQLRASWDGTSEERVLPAPGRPSAAGFPQTGHRAGRAYDPEPPGSGGDEPPPAGTALAPAGRRHPDGVLLGEI
jgi:hypothetical protein